jgi:hypothetical protein
VQSARPQACAVVQTSGIPFEDNCPIGKESILAKRVEEDVKDSSKR